MPRAHAIFLTTLVALMTAAARAADPSIIWQIGQVDQSFREFSAVEDVFGGYLRAFPRGVNFEVGRSDPARDFSPAHPGPIDSWAGSREHPFTITFDLPGKPAWAYELAIAIVDTQGNYAPSLRVTINDQSLDLPLEKGTGDLSAIDPSKGQHRTLRLLIPGGDVRPRGNRLILTNTRGSWILYDALSLTALAEEDAPPLEVKVRPTIFMVEKDGRLLQEVVIEASGLIIAEPVAVEVRAGGEVITSTRVDRPRFGRLHGRMHIPPVTVERQLVVTVAGGTQSATVEMVQKPIRKWRIYCAPSTHTDIGYTDHQEKVIALHNRNTDLALELSRAFPLYHWNLESSWAAQVWLRDNPPYRHQELYEAARKARVGIEASYLNMLTGLCSDEELIRTMYYSARLLREHGVPFVSYTLTDAPSHVWSLPSILAGAGIRCISIGSNPTRAPILRKNIHHRAPFWWEGPDGAKILTWITAGYSQAGLIGLREGLSGMQEAIERTLIWWNDRTDYPYDALLLHGAYSDNVAIAHDIAESITAYSQVYAYPKVILCSNDVFFRYIEENFANRIPTVRGCGGSWWEDGAASTALETGINRLAHADAVAAEAAWAVAHTLTGSPVPQQRFNTCWDHMLLYDEHTWGAHNSISDPTLDFVTRQWATKASYGIMAADAAVRLLDEGLRELAGRVQGPDEGVLVFNPSGRARSGIVQAKIPRKMTLADPSGRPVPTQIVMEDVLDNVTVWFRAEDVPPAGYKVYALVPRGEDPPVSTRYADHVLENEFYKVVLDPASGGIVGIVDRKLGRELVDAASSYRLGQLIYAAGGKCEGQYFIDCPQPAEVRVDTARGVRIEPGRSGPIYTSVRAIASHAMFHAIELETVLYEHEPRIDFVFRLNKKMTFEKEAVYLAFPFAGTSPRFRYEIGGANVRPNEDHWPGGCRDWFSVQRWVTVHTDQAAVAWSPVDTPLVTFCDLTPGKWLEELPITNGTIFAYVMNNYWFTNYKAGQDGEFVFRYSLTSGAGFDPAAATLFGEDVQNPMRAVRLFPGRQNRTLPASGSFCRVEPADHVALTTIKPADDGKGLIVRIRETGGKPAQASIALTLPGLTRVRRCDLVEREIGPAPQNGGKVLADLKPYGWATLRFAPPE